MIRYYHLFTRLGRLDGKYAHEATMDWMQPAPKVLSIVEIRDYLSQLNLYDFLNELIKIFKEDTICYLTFAECLKLNINNDHATGDMLISNNNVRIRIEPDKETNNVQISTLKIQIDNVSHLKLIENKKIEIDKSYDLGINSIFDKSENALQIILKVIRKQA